jgi:hypothetical protein
VDESTAGAGGPWTVLATYTTSTETTFGTGSLTPGADYWWEVISYTSLGGSSTSNVLGTVQPPVAGLNVTKPAPTSAEFNWTNNASYGGTLGFVSYELFEDKNGSAAQLVASIVNPSVLTYTVTGLPGGSGYSFYLNTTDCYANCGGAGEGFSTTSSNVVTFGTPQALGASVSASRSFVDAGEADLFNCNPTGGVTPYFFDWSFAGGPSQPGDQSISHGFAAGSGSASCKVTDHTGANYTAATSVTVNPAPSIDASVNRSTADVGQPVGFNCVPSNGSPPFSTSWSYGDGSPGGAADSSHAYSSPATVVASCTATDQADVEVSQLYTLTISPVPAVSASVNSLYAAPLTLLSFTGVAENGTGTFTDTHWNFGDGTIAHGARVTHVYTTAGNYTASFHATDSNGPSASQALAITIRPLLVTLVADPTATHPGVKVTFTANASGGAGGPYNYSWTFGDGTVGYGASVVHTYSGANTYHPGLVVSDPLGAKALPSLATVAVTTPPAPTPAVSAWTILAIALLAGLLIGLVAYSRLRRSESEQLSSQAPWVPRTDPSRTVRGVKVCRACGTANLPIRSTCEACGADLPRWAKRTT